MRTLLSIVLFLSLAPQASAQALRPFTPPRFLRGDLPAGIPPQVVMGGEVVIEAVVNQQGALTRPTVIRTTAPFTNMLLDVIARWGFKPAEAIRSDDTIGPVESSIVITAVYRPPVLVNDGLTVGDLPRDIAKPSNEVAFPLSLVTPPHPIHALSGFTASLVLYEVSLDEGGSIRNARALASDAAYESAARDALMQWRFRPSTYRGKPVPAVSYVLFGFPALILGPPQLSGCTGPDKACEDQPPAPSAASPSTPSSTPPSPATPRATQPVVPSQR